jgi:hypothetical protein
MTQLRRFREGVCTQQCKQTPQTLARARDLVMLRFGVSLDAWNLMVRALRRDANAPGTIGGSGAPSARDSGCVPDERMR